MHESLAAAGRFRDHGTYGAGSVQRRACPLIFMTLRTLSCWPAAVRGRTGANTHDSALPDNKRHSRCADGARRRRYIVLILAAVLLSLPLYAAPVLSVDKTALNWSGRYGLVAGLYGPIPLSVSVSNTGDGTLQWSAATSGGTAANYVQLLSSTGTVNCSGGGGARFACTGGSGAATLRLTLTGWWASLSKPGEYTTSLVFTNTNTGETVTVPITIEVVPKAVSPVFTPLREPVGCVNTHQKFGADPDTCTVPGDRPPESFDVPPTGGTYTDPNFGSTVRVLTEPRWVHAYSSLTAFNKDGTLAVVANPSAVYKVVNTTTGAVVDPAPPGSGVWRLWSSLDPSVYYYATGATLHRYKVKGGSTVVRNFAAEGLTSITTGGQADLSRDDWVPFFDTKAKKVCGYDIPRNKLYCASYDGMTLVDQPNYILITKGKDRESGKRYVLLMANPGLLYTVNEESGVLEGPLVMPPHIGSSLAALTDWDPEVPCNQIAGAACMKHGHDDTVEGADGGQYLVLGAYYSSPNAQGIVAYRISKGKLMSLPVELGGGMHVLYWYQPGSGVAYPTMNHVGCARSAPYCVISTGRRGYGGVSQGASAAQKITGATNESSIRITVSSDHPYVAGDIVNIGGVQGNTAANGVWTVESVIDRQNFTIAADGRESGKFVAGYAVVGRGHALRRWPYEAEIITFEVGKEAPLIRRVAMNRTLYYQFEDGTNFGYWAIPRACISPDGTKVLYSSNFGIPTQYRVVVAETGLGREVPMGVQEMAVRGNETLIAYRAENAQACSRQLSTAHTFTPATVVSDGGGAVHRVWHLTGLSPATTYYWKVSCPSTRLHGQFTTGVTPPGKRGPTALQLSASPGLAVSHARVDWGYTSAREQTPVVAGCADQCSVALDTTGGQIVHVRWTWLDSLGRELARSAGFAAAVE